MAQLSDQYVTAAAELILDGVPVSTVMTGLKSTLVERKHSSLLPVVLTQLHRELPVRLRERTPQVRVVSPASLEEQRSYIESELATMHAPADYDVSYDESLIGGAVIQYGSTRIDNSYKHTLKNLYKHIITS